MTAIISISLLMTVYDYHIYFFLLWREESGGVFLFAFLLLSPTLGPQSCGQYLAAQKIALTRFRW